MTAPEKSGVHFRWGKDSEPARIAKSIAANSSSGAAAWSSRNAPPCVRARSPLRPAHCRPGSAPPALFAGAPCAYSIVLSWAQLVWNGSIFTGDAIARGTRVHAHGYAGALEYARVLPKHHLGPAARIVSQYAKPAGQERHAGLSELCFIHHRQFIIANWGARRRLTKPARTRARDNSPTPITAPPQQPLNAACPKARSEVCSERLARARRSPGRNLDAVAKPPTAFVSPAPGAGQDSARIRFFPRLVVPHPSILDKSRLDAGSFQPVVLFDGGTHGFVKSRAVKNRSIGGHVACRGDDLSPPAVGRRQNFRQVTADLLAMSADDGPFERQLNGPGNHRAFVR